MNKHFVTGFVCGLLLFIAINLLAAHLASDCGLSAVFGSNSCADAITRVGWPLQYYESSGFVYQRNFNPLFFLIDMLVAFAMAAGMGWLFSRGKKTPPK
jgi:hypothetical protein